MAGRKLVANVYVSGVLYPAGSSPEKAIADRITNPKAWGGKASEEPAAAAFPDGKPEEAWKGDQLKAYAESKSIDLAGASSKAEMVKAIEAAEAAPAS